MTPEAAHKLEDFFRGFARGTDAILLLDFDGTLAPFRLDRFTARPWAGVRELLTSIQHGGAQALRTRIAVITGRPAGEIAPMLGLDPALEVWGLHGAERLYADGRRELEQGTPATMEKLGELRESLKRDSLGGLYEDKANGAVMHWRGASAQKARQIEARTRALFEPLTHMDGLRLLEFESGLELRVGRDKGGAVEAILAEAATSGPVAYLGDDLTDEAAFRVVNALGPRGLSVLVRRERRATEAQVWLRPPDELKEFLKRWLDAGSSSQR